MLAVTHDLDLVRDILDRMLPSADLQPLLDHLADDVEFTVAAPDGGSHTHHGTGKAAVLAYFETLGDLITFWQVKYSWSGGRVVVLAEESFTIKPCDLTAQSELTLIFDVRDGLITRLLVAEDTPAAGIPSTPGRWAASLPPEVQGVTVEEAAEPPDPLIRGTL